MPFHNRLCTELARDPEKSHDLYTLDVVPPHARRIERTPTNDEMQLEPKDVSRDVERLLSKWAEIEYFSSPALTGRIDASNSVRKGKVLRVERTVIGGNGEPIYSVLKGEAPETVRSTGQRGGAPVAAPDRPAQLWKSTISLKLKRLSRMHEDALLDAAEVRLWIDAIRRNVQSLESILGSPSAQFKIRAYRGRIEDMHDIGAAYAECLVGTLLRIIRSRRYGEAVLLFWLELTETAETKAYCLAPLEKNHRWN
jgi:hypothetical protein